LFTLCNFLFWSVLLLRLWRPLPYTRIAVGTLSLLVVLTGLSAWAKSHSPPVAYVIQETVPVRYGPSVNDTARFDLFDGDAVSIKDRREGWYRVMTIDGEQGWVSDADILAVGPPYGPPAPLYTEDGVDE
jgi:hypothetical protein